MPVGEGAGLRPEPSDLPPATEYLAVPTGRERQSKTPWEGTMINPEAAVEMHDHTPLRLLVVTDTRFVGEALAQALAGHPAIAAVSCVNSAQAAGSVAQADAILVDAN